MDHTEKEALNKLKTDIKVNVLITANMLRKLEAQGMITKAEREMLMKLVDGSVRNPKLIEILKRKPGGFKALTEVMMFDSRVNKHFVDKLNHIVREHHADKKLARPKVDQEAFKKMQDKLEICMKLYWNVVKLVSGENHERESSISKEIVDYLIGQLEKCRSFLDESHIDDDIPLKGLQEKHLSSIKEAYMSKEHQIQKEIETLKEKNAKLYNKCTVLQQEIDMMRTYQDEIINDTVEQKVRNRLLRHDIQDRPPTMELLTPRSTNGHTSIGASPRGGTINIGKIGNCRIQVADELYNVDSRNGDKDDESDSSS